MGVILVGFIAGIAGTILVLNMAGISITNVSGSSTKTTTSSVSYSNSNDTTKAVEKVQDAVVSVINYKSDSSSSASDLYNQMFGNDSDSSSNSSSTDDLTVYSEGSGVIYKKMVILPMSSLTITLLMVPNKLKLCLLMEQKLLVS